MNEWAEKKRMYLLNGAYDSKKKKSNIGKCMTMVDARMDSTDRKIWKAMVNELYPDPKMALNVCILDFCRPPTCCSFQNQG